MGTHNLTKNTQNLFIVSEVNFTVKLVFSKKYVSLNSFRKYTSAGFFRTQFRVVKMRLKKWRIVSNRHDPPPKWRAAVSGRAGPRGRFLAVLRQFASSLSPRGVYFIIRRPERLERTRRREGFDAAPPHGQRLFLGRKLGVPRNIPNLFFFSRNSLVPNLPYFNHPPGLGKPTGSPSHF